MSVKIIAEAGVNHNGDLALAYRLADVAKAAGADIIKFQTYLPEKLVTEDAPLAEYQEKSEGAEESQYAMLKRLALSFEEFRSLSDYCKKIGIEFLSTPFDLESIDFLAGLGMNIWKIPSGEATNLPYLERIAACGGEVILSTGMCTIKEVEAAVDIFKNAPTEHLTLLHCTTAYPAPKESINLRAMTTLGEHFSLPVGYSDHTEGLSAALAAVAMGATVIEKHFTLDKNMQGPDHKASLDPAELTALVREIRALEQMLGNGEKIPTALELQNAAVARKSIVAAGDIAAGAVFTEENLTTKRPADGISPMRWHDLIGKVALRAYRKDEKIDEGEL